MSNGSQLQQQGDVQVRTGAVSGKPLPLTQREGKEHEESESARGTQQLEKADEGTSQENEGKQASKGHPLERAEEGIGQDARRKQDRKGHSPAGGRRGCDQSGHRKEVG